MIVPVILSGGEGKRLWPLSTPARPKQFLALTGPESLLQQTARRLHAPELFADPLVVGSADHRFQIAEQLREAGLRAGSIVLEPVGRNTAPAIAVAALLALQDDPAALILVCPADHAIADGEAFRRAVRQAEPAARAGRFVLFGVAPTHPATGYGYIVPGAPLDGEVRTVARFVEKPAEAVARALIAEGALWNSGVFLLPVGPLLAGLERVAAAVLAAAKSALAHAAADADFLRLDPKAFAAAPSISIDHALMENTDNAAVAPADFAWSDIGSWSAVWEAQARDAAGNASSGQVVLDETTGCLVHADGVRVAACGLTDLIIVASGERVLIIPRKLDQRVRELGERADKA